ncbi:MULTISPECIES: hypothetical protein, partial [unclassified Delftia]|uniref:hypothetical protein n=1 Tax=unclassified Delftia TaxID=2613839 RepID=UPI001F30C45B
MSLLFDGSPAHARLPFLFQIALLFAVRGDSCTKWYRCKKALKNYRHGPITHLYGAGLQATKLAAVHIDTAASPGKPSKFFILT